MTRYLFHISLFLTIIVGFQSCGINNFNKQKHTKLQKIKPSFEKADEAPDQETLNDNIPSNEKHDSKDEFKEEVQNNTVSSEESTFVNTVSENTKKTRKKAEIHNRKKKIRGPGTRFDFEQLSDAEKRQNIVEFNRLFNITLLLFLIGCLLVAIGFVNLYLAVLAAPFWVAAWICSFIPLLRVKRIDKTKYARSLRLRITWLKVLNYIGIVIAIGLITPGIVLLILWLARKI